MRRYESQRPGGNRPVAPPPYRRNRKRKDWRPVIKRTLIAAAVVSVVVFLLTYHRFQVQRVRFIGDKTISYNELKHLVPVTGHVNIFLDLLLHHRQIANRIEQGEPAVASAHVRPGASRLLGWPNTLNVYLTERVAYVQLRENHGGLWLVDKSGVPYRTLKARKPGLMCIVVPFDAVTPELGKPLPIGDGTYLGAAFSALAVVEKSNALSPGLVKDVRVDQNFNLCLNTSSNLLIKLGQPDKLETKISKAGAILTDASQQASDAVYIDVSEPDHPTLMPRPGSNLVGASSN